MTLVSRLTKLTMMVAVTILAASMLASPLPTTRAICPPRAGVLLITTARPPALRLGSPGIFRVGKRMRPRLDLAKALAAILARIQLRGITLEERRLLLLLLHLLHLLHGMRHSSHPTLELTRLIHHPIPTRNAVQQPTDSRHRTSLRRVGVQGRALFCHPRTPGIPPQYLIYTIYMPE